MADYSHRAGWIFRSRASLGRPARQSWRC